MEIYLLCEKIYFTTEFGDISYMGDISLQKIEIISPFWRYISKKSQKWRYIVEIYQFRESILEIQAIIAGCAGSEP